ncbi:type 4a pilus biogenesis protein PilO [Piscinibacterium candidicorallinum]|uniref:Type 4a pilus biogenesis protein PilO n=1 Tax=Piscinibacterium candidicorallinum TaxID=1793872 RepID=A0ABV7H0T2_9BURK
MDFKQLSAQFQNLSNDPGTWPIAPKVATLVFILAALVAGGWYFYWSGQLERLEAERAKEVQLLEAYRGKMQQAINLDELKKQKVQVSQYVLALERQLPGKAEMDALLSDINTAGLGRGLVFELFKPSGAVVKQYYAEIPISIKVNGGFHDIASFSSDLAGLPRIVTLNNMNIAVLPTGSLALDATAKTFRYLDPQEQAAQQAKPAGAPGAQGAAAGAAK